MDVLREYIEGDMKVTEFTTDGETVSHIVRVSILEYENSPIIEDNSEIKRLQEQVDFLTLQMLDLMGV